MQKKYFKYILIIAILIFSFNMHVMAAATKIQMSVKEEKGTICTYSYDGVTLNLYETYDGKIAVETAGSSSSYRDFSVDYLTNANHIKNTCSNMYATPVLEINAANEQIYILYFYFDRSEVTGVFNSYDTYTTATLKGTQKSLTHTCIYYPKGSGISSDATYLKVYYNKNNGRTKYEIGGKGEISTDISKKLKKSISNMSYSKEKGLSCSQIEVVIDYCSATINESKKYNAYYRTSSEAALSLDNAYKCQSTNPKDGVTIITDDSKGNYGEIFALSDICKNEKNVMIVVRFIGYLLFIVKILVPLGLIIVGIINFSKVVITGDADEMKKNTQKFAYKLIFAVVIFVLPTIINFLIGLVDGAVDGTQDYENCRSCIFDPKNCKIPS